MNLCVYKASSVLSAILSCVYAFLDAVTVQQSFSRWQCERKSQQNGDDPALALCEAAMVSSFLTQPDLCNCLSEAFVSKGSGVIRI